MLALADYLAKSFSLLETDFVEAAAVLLLEMENSVSALVSGTAVLVASSGVFQAALAVVVFQETYRITPPLSSFN